ANAAQVAVRVTNQPGGGAAPGCGAAQGGVRGGSPPAPAHRRGARHGRERYTRRVLPRVPRLRRVDGLRPRASGARRRSPRSRRGGRRRLDAGERPRRNRARGDERQSRGDAAMSARLDAVTLEVLWTRVISDVDEASKATG